MKRKKTRRYISGMLVAVLLFLLCVVQNVNAEDVSGWQRTAKAGR